MVSARGRLGVSVVGVGATPQGSLGGQYSGDDLAIWALREALADAWPGEEGG